MSTEISGDWMSSLIKDNIVESNFGNSFYKEYTLWSVLTNTRQLAMCMCSTA